MSEAIWLRFRGTQAEKIYNAITLKGEFTAIVSRSEVKPKQHQLCLVSVAESPVRRKFRRP